MKQSIPLTSKRYNFSYCTPTVDIKDIQTLKDHLDLRSAYCIVPGIEETFAFDIYAMIAEILPLTEYLYQQIRKTLVDICLPYLDFSKKRPIQHLARYFICNKKLIAIKIKASQNWPQSRSEEISIPEELHHIYEGMGADHAAEKIVVAAEMTVQVAGFKIAPFFESQLSSVDGSNTRKILSEYYDQGCSVFSVVNDLTEERKRNLISPIQYLKQHRKDSTITVYCGSNLAVSKDTIYQTKSFIRQGNQESNIRIEKFDRIQKRFFVVDQYQILQSRKTLEAKNFTKEDINVYYNSQFLRRSFDDPNIYNTRASIDIEEEALDENLKKQMFLWHIYSDVNQGNQIILPYPLDPNSQSLLQIVESLCLRLERQPNDLVKLLSTQKAKRVPSEFESYKVYKDLSKSQQTPMYLYFDIQNSKLKEELKKYSNVYSVFESLPKELFEKELEQNPQGQSESATEEFLFVQKFIFRKKSPSIDFFYNDALSHFTRNKLTEELLRKLYNELRAQIKLHFKPHPFYNLVSQKGFQSLRQAFSKIELRSLSHRQGIKREDGEQLGQQEGSFRKQIQKVKTFAQGQKKQNIMCHICGIAFPRKKEINYGKKCYVCQNFICLSCYDDKTGKVAQSQEMFGNCLYCQKLCDCYKCSNRFAKSKSEHSVLKQQFPPKSNKKTDLSFIGSKLKIDSCIDEEPLEPNQKNRQNGALELDSVDETQLQLLKGCETCLIYQRNGMNIDFECSKCFSIKCLGCEKSQNSKVIVEIFQRNWDLRAQILCNACYESESKKADVELTYSQIVARLQGEIQHLRREKFMKHPLYQPVSTQMSNALNEPIAEQSERDSQSEQQLRFADSQSEEEERGNATPFLTKQTRNFDGNASPNRSDSNSLASFGGRKKTPERKRSLSNSSGSSNSRRKAKHQTSSKHKEEQYNRSQNLSRSNSVSSERSERVKRDKGKDAENSVSRSASSQRSQKRKQRRYSEAGSQESGEYKGSQSSKDSVHYKNNNKWGQVQQSSRNQRNGRGRGNHYGRGGEKSFGWTENRNSDRDNGNWGNRGGNRNYRTEGWRDNRNQQGRGGFQNRGRGDRGRGRGRGRGYGRDFNNNRDNDGFRSDNFRDANSHGNSYRARSDDSEGYRSKGYEEEDVNKGPLLFPSKTNDEKDVEAIEEY